MKLKGTVLLVEDNAELNVNNARALRMLGYAVHPALTLAEAKVWLAGNEPDIILLDVMLPDGDGIDFCAAIRGAPVRTGAHILFLTAKAEHEDRVRGLAQGGDDYIAKPFHPEELLARVEAAMRRRSMPKPNTPEKLPANITEEEKLRAFAAHFRLSDKESQVLFLILQRLSIKEMAERMGVSAKGIEYHITKILLKTGITRRSDLAAAFTLWQ